MSSSSIRSIAITLGVLIMILAPAALLAAPCANLTVSVNPTVVARGGTVTITASINNCSSAEEVVKIKYSISSPYIPGTVVGSVSFGLAAGETRTASVSFAIPSFVYPGNYTITATASSGAIVLATSSTTLTVE